MDGPHRLLWAKFDRDTGAWHPLLCHMIDVAMVALSLWRHVLGPAARFSIGKDLEIDDESAGNWIAFWAGLHDLGKASPAFALKAELPRAWLKKAGFPSAGFDPDLPHGTVTAFVLPDVLSEFGVPNRLALTIASAIGGHHGVLVSSTAIAGASQAAVGRGLWAVSRSNLSRELASVLGFPHTPPGRMTNAVAMFLAGLVSVADWIGSAEKYFSYVAEQPLAVHIVNPEAYAGDARTKAIDALARLGWTGWKSSAGEPSFSSLFPHIDQPNPLQREIISLAPLLAEPSLVVIEAPMGDGKTEAAMFLADWWRSFLGQVGCYFALPTQATSNQMFSRVLGFLSARYPGELVNLQLLHGHAALSAEFEELRRNADRLFQPRDIHGTGSDVRVSPQVVAAEWFTHRKRGLLAPFGVGTIDQALMAALQTPHVFVRLFGLAHKTVIIDEVHAYDTYMTTILERLLEWLAALGSSVVLLSATLPRDRCRGLREAFRRGLSRATALDPAPDESYPKITWVTTSASGGRKVGTSGLSAKSVRLKWADGDPLSTEEAPFSLGESIKAALSMGGCAAIICNTVGRAQQMYSALKPYLDELAEDGYPEIDLLHARFVFEERDRREKRALLRFGKQGGKVELEDGRTVEVLRPRRAVLVATQVIEQSLDLDFDLMVTDIAPVDLVLQRAGRLWRHQRTRPPGIEAPELWLCGPAVLPGGVPDFGRGNESVYDPHALLRSWLGLKDRQVIRIPEDVETLVEAVYDANRACPAALGEALSDYWDRTRRKHQEEIASEQREAKDRWLNHPAFSGAFWHLTENPREEDAPDFHRSHQALTRLTPPTAQVICLHGTTAKPALDRAIAETIDPNLVPTIATAKRLLRRSASISDRRVVFELLDREVPRGWRQSPLLRHHRLVALNEQDEMELGKYVLRMDDELGLVITAPA